MTKGLIRSLSRRGTRSEKSPQAGLPRRTPPTTACHGCGGVFARKTWRHDHPVNERTYERVVWRLCPACRQVARGEGYGKVVIRGAADVEDAIRRRIANVAARARTTQPQRRLVSITRNGAALEVVTSSQKLAHRVAREIEKAFGGRATYAWDGGDGSLCAEWSATASARTSGNTRRARTGRRP